MIPINRKFTKREIAAINQYMELQKFTKREIAAINQYIELQTKDPIQFEKIKNNLLKILKIGKPEPIQATE